MQSFIKDNVIAWNRTALWRANQARRTRDAARYRRNLQGLGA